MGTFSGYCEDDQIPVKKGQMITIVKGTPIRTMHPDPAKKMRIAKRTYKVKVDHVLNGMSDHKYEWNEATRTYDDVYTPRFNPSVRWPGEGGYWFEVDLNLIPEAAGGS